MHDSHYSTVALLALIIGRRPAKKYWRGSLVELFLGERLPKDLQFRLVSARELVRRWMQEELTHGPILNDRVGVREYLRVHFAGADREVFSVLFLGKERQLVAAED